MYEVIMYANWGWDMSKIYDQPRARSDAAVNLAVEKKPDKNKNSLEPNLVTEPTHWTAGQLWARRYAGDGE